MELDIGSYRGIDSIKHIEMTTKFMPFGKKKVYILDEAHALTGPAWDATLKMLEDCGDHILFILCASSEGEIPEVARSRCQKFTFQRLEPRAMVKKLAVINHRERFDIDQNSLRFIAEFAQGNMRSAEKMLEQVVNLNHGHPGPRQIRRFLQAKMPEA
jgi:DNA polymerase-3 subunit gamma/tau